MSKKRKTDEDKENPLKLSKVTLCEDCIEDISDINTSDVEAAKEYMESFSTTVPARGLHEPFNVYLQRIVAEEVTKVIPSINEYEGSSTDGCSSDGDDYFY
nr:hypothetical protein [Cressdnaviricota sp.]UOF78021.1 hypothetical protein [Cressdnaviricota sp.]UOF78308.1 hypothetical protein [Cressdnaviricota sp.]UOF79237.1 hypothetical protein [Cressdnaviricota sp.]UOF82975.1 hypothetical protein [Cressdnaviricota sp.]